MKIGQRLDIVNISKYYGDFKVLDSINLVCEPGEFVTILGSSGSGKTTLLKVIAGFESNSDGSIYINNESIVKRKAYERNIGMLFQNYALFPHMTVEENVAYPLKLRKVSKKEIREKVENILKVVKLNNMGKRYPKQLSGGQQQRVALARAIVYNPPLLLLDEPLGALDMNLRHNMQFEIKRITKELGITTISVTHDQEEAFAMSDKICIMSDGKVQQFATPEEIYERPSNRFVAEFMGTTNIIGIKNITYLKRDDNYTLIKGITEISETPMELVVETKYINRNINEALFTLRPESIHLASEKSFNNEFTVKLEESVYLGERVKIKASALSKLLNINLNVNEFRNLENPDDVRLVFAPEDVAVIYDK